MAHFLLIVLPVLALQGTVAQKFLEVPRWKSFQDAELECAEILFITADTLERYRSNGYPNEPSDWKLLSCVLETLHAWDVDKQQVKDYVFSQYFNPNTVDCLYKQHTQECLAQNVETLDPTDRLRRAYWTVQCYLTNYAGIKEEPQWVPYQYSEILQTTMNCLHINNPSNDSLLQYCQGRFATNPDYPHQGYCFLVQSGFYNKSSGFDLHKLYVQHGNAKLLEDDVKDCIAADVNQYCKEPYRLASANLNCLVKYTLAKSAIVEAASGILGNPPECGIPPSPPPKTQPCYNGPCP